MFVHVFYVSAKFSRSEFVREVAVGEVGGIGGKISIVLMEDEGLYCVFTEGYIVRNMYWLGLLDDFYIIYL